MLNQNMYFKNILDNHKDTSRKKSTYREIYSLQCIYYSGRESEKSMILTSFYKNQKKNKTKRKSKEWKLMKIINEFTMEKINKAKSQLFMKINKIDKTLAVRIKKKEKI